MDLDESVPQLLSYENAVFLARTMDLFSEFPLRELSVPNRVMMSPMCQYSAKGDGVPTEWHHVHYGSRAVGGAGIIMLEATAVEPRGRISPGDLGIWNDTQQAQFEQITSFIQDHDSVPAIQLAHAGRKASTAVPSEGGDGLMPDEGGWTTVGPTDNPYPRDGTTVPVSALATEDVQNIVNAFRDSAVKARDAGFQIAEIHAAHGYLIHQFLSPVTNQRDDRYGGSFKNRTRFLREITEAVRSVWPDNLPIFARISATDWLPDHESWTIEDSTRAAEMLAECGVDLIDVSAGGLHPDQQLPDTGPNYMVPFAETIREQTSVPVGAVGKITSGEQADALIRNGRADLAVVGREHLRDPYFTLHAARQLGRTDDIDWPVQYQRAVR